MFLGDAVLFRSSVGELVAELRSKLAAAEARAGLCEMFEQKISMLMSEYGEAKARSEAKGMTTKLKDEM